MRNDTEVSDILSRKRLQINVFSRICCFQFLCMDPFYFSKLSSGVVIYYVPRSSISMTSGSEHRCEIAGMLVVVVETVRRMCSRRRSSENKHAKPNGRCSAWPPPFLATQAGRQEYSLCPGQLAGAVKKLLLRKNRDLPFWAPTAPNPNRVRVITCQAFISLLFHVLLRNAQSSAHDCHTKQKFSETRTSTYEFSSQQRVPTPTCCLNTTLQPLGSCLQYKTILQWYARCALYIC